MNSAPASAALLYFTERGSGPPLLLVHGLMATGEMFEPVTGQLATRHRVIVPDLRGHGRSRGLPPPYTAAQLAADLSRLLDHLGIDATAVLGYSQGGAIAQQLALEYPKRCDRLVLACTYAFNMATPREWLQGHLVPLLLHILGTRGLAKLVVAASEDQAVPIHHARMLHEGIPGSQLVIIDGADHALIWTHPDEFLRTAEEFLGA